ncbi:MAG: hypothetical protein ACRDYC_03860, partial [Acidimicrobiales bacterium]
PRNWTSIPFTMLDIAEPSAQFVGGSSVPSGGGDGMNGILIAPGYVGRSSGRNGYTVQLAYVNGWPIAGLTDNASSGDTIIEVDDVTGMAGCRPMLWDGGRSETVTVLEAVATDPITVLPGVVAQAGPGTLTLASVLAYDHIATVPASVVISALPDIVRQASYYIAAADAMQRGSTVFTVQALPGSVLSGGQPTVQSFLNQAAKMLGRLGRVF